MKENNGEHEERTVFHKPKITTALWKNNLFGDNRFWSVDGSNIGAYLLPIRLTMLYLTVSVLIYAFGPFKWTTYTPVLFYSLLVLYMAALWFGYRIGLMRKYANAIEWKEEYTDKVMGLLSVLVVVNFFIYIVNILRDYGLTTFDFPELFKQMAVGIKNPGLGYNLRFERVESLQGTDVMGGTLMSLFNYLWAFFRYPILIFSMLYFKRMNIVGKVFTVLYLFFMVLFYMSIGTTIDVLHVFLLLEIEPIISAFTSWHERELTKGKVVRLVACVMAGFLFIGGYFTWMMISRGGINNYDQPDYNIGGVQLNESVLGIEETTVPMTEPVPETTVPMTEPVPATTVPPTTVPPVEEVPVEPTIWSKISSVFMKFWISFSSYFAQGYYGMSQGLTLPWTPMFGAGSSMFVVDFITEHVYDIDQYTYQVKIEEAYGWGANMQWHSMYTWLANDVSFYGVIFVMFLIGVLFAAMFKDAITTNNPFAKASVFYFMLMMLFIPCNNQLGQRAETLLSFLLVVMCWLISKYASGFIKKLFARGGK